MRRLGVQSHYPITQGCMTSWKTSGSHKNYKLCTWTYCDTFILWPLTLMITSWVHMTPSSCNLCVWWLHHQFTWWTQPVLEFLFSWFSLVHSATIALWTQFRLALVQGIFSSLFRTLTVRQAATSPHCDMQFLLLDIQIIPVIRYPNNSWY